jgi:hypothetical protein
MLILDPEEEHLSERAARHVIALCRHKNCDRAISKFDEAKRNAGRN